MDLSDDLKDESKSSADSLYPPGHHGGLVTSDLPDRPDPMIQRLSTISSDFDSCDKCSETSSGQNSDSGREEEAVLKIVHVTPGGVQEKHGASDVATDACVTLPDLRNEDCNSTTRADDFVKLPVTGDVKPLEKTDELSVSPSSTSVSEETLSPENSVCADSLASTAVEEHSRLENATLDQERSSKSVDYPPKVYSDNSVDISDGGLSDASVEKSRPSRIQLGNSSFSVVSPLRHRASSDVLTDSEGTPPASLDSDGAEELSDTASWPRSPSNGAWSDHEKVYPEGVKHLEESSSSPSSGSSHSQSPGSNQTGLRMLADSWAEYSPPGQGYVQFLAVSDMHIWCVTMYDLIFYCPTHFSVVTWTQLRGTARMLAVNHGGDVIWCIDRKNYAYVRVGINQNHLTGRKWQPVEKEMRFVAVDRSAVWGIKVSNLDAL